MEACADTVERVKYGCFSVAMAEKYGMSTDFCDFITDFGRTAAAVYPALCAGPIGQDMLFAC